MTYLNGRIVPESQAVVSVYDRGFMAGHGVFDRTRTCDGEPFHLDRHVARLYRSLRTVGLDPGLTEDEMLAATLDLLARNRPLLRPNDDYIVGHYITRGRLRGSPTTVILCEPIDWAAFAHQYADGAHVVSTSVRAIPSQVWDPKIKATSRLHFWLAEEQAHLVDADAYALLLTVEGNVAELNASNIWIVRDGKLITPPADTALSGITRGAVWEVAQQLGIPSEERHFQLYDVINADEAFLTSASRLVLPVTRVDGRAIGDGEPGPIVGKLQRGWAELYEFDFVAQALAHVDRPAASPPIDSGRPPRESAQPSCPP
jgi:branched-chain amino acid aminotransferase